MGEAEALSVMQSQQPTTPSAESKRFNRIFLTINDLSSCVRYFWAAQRAEEKGDLDAWEGLIAAGIIAYARPFSGNGKSTSTIATPPLPKGLSDSEKALHKKLTDLRHDSVAHSIGDKSPFYSFVSASKISFNSAIHNPRLEGKNVATYIEHAEKMLALYESMLNELADRVPMHGSNGIDQA